MSDIDRKLARLVCLKTNYTNTRFWVPSDEIGDYMDDDGLHDWLLSPPGTVAILEAFLRDGIGYLTYPTTDGVTIRVEVAGTNGTQFNEVTAPTLSEAAYAAARKYMEVKDE